MLDYRDPIVQWRHREKHERADGHRGYEATRILRDKPVDLLIADIMLPGMDGVQVAMHAKQVRPGIKVLFATGYAQKATERNAFRHGAVLFKPVRRAELIREVDILLGRAA